MTAPLTKRQRSVYEFIESYIHEKGFGPTVREIAEAVNLSSPSTVHVHLKTLEEKGYIVRDPLGLLHFPTLMMLTYPSAPKALITPYLFLL